MTPDQKRAIEVAKRLAERHGRRPTGRELQQERVTFGPKKVFQTINALLVAAGLAEPAGHHRAGFLPAEEKLLLRLFEEGAPVGVMAEKLGVINQVVANEIADRALTRTVVRRKKGDPVILTRRCQVPKCGRITHGAGPCEHCGADGLTSAA